MSGQKINDHSFWAGGMSKSSVLAQGVKMKGESSAEGAGHLNNYEDTTEEIKAYQMRAKAKVKSHTPVPGNRN